MAALRRRLRPSTTFGLPADHVPGHLPAGVEVDQPTPSRSSVSSKSRKWRCAQPPNYHHPSPQQPEPSSERCTKPKAGPTPSPCFGPALLSTSARTRRAPCHQTACRHDGNYYRPRRDVSTGYCHRLPHLVLQAIDGLARSLHRSAPPTVLEPQVTYVPRSRTPRIHPR